MELRIKIEQAVRDPQRVSFSNEEIAFLIRSRSWDDIDRLFPIARQQFADKLSIALQEGTAHLLMDIFLKHRNCYCMLCDDQYINLYYYLLAGNPQEIQSALQYLTIPRKDVRNTSPALLSSFVFERLNVNLPMGMTVQQLLLAHRSVESIWNARNYYIVAQFSDKKAYEGFFHITGRIQQAFDECAEFNNPALLEFFLDQGIPFDDIKRKARVESMPSQETFLWETRVALNNWLIPDLTKLVVTYLTWRL